MLHVHSCRAGVCSQSKLHCSSPLLYSAYRLSAHACTLLQAKYYQEKLGISKHNPADWRQVVHSFIEGLHWVLEYYYRGVASWTWFFPYHYAPMISDMVGIEEFHVAFQQGKPFLPFQQLLGVLPSASHRLLPEPYQASYSLQ